MYTAEEILNDAREHGKPNYQDYERYKKWLHANNHYGYEHELACILGI